MNPDILTALTTEIKDSHDEDYVPSDYPRSDVEYAHVPFDEFLSKRSLNLFDALLGRLEFPGLIQPIIAGGFVADLVSGSNMAQDIDLFFRSERALEVTMGVLANAGYRLVEEDKSFISPLTGLLLPGSDLDDKPFFSFTSPQVMRNRQWCLQAIKIRYYDNAEHVIDSFDFTCIQFALDMSARKLVFNPAGACDLAAKRLVQHRVESRERVLKRLAKYQGKGFHETDSFVLPPKEE